MRHFSENEKKTIKSIVEQSSSSQYVLINAYGDIFYSKKVEFDYKNRQLVFYRDIDSVELDDILAVEHEILERSILIKHLIDNRYIYLIDDNSENEITSVGGFLKDGLTPIKKVINKEVSDILYTCANHRVFVGQDLIELYKNGFKSIEDATLDEARKQTKISKNTLRISLLALLFSIILPFLLKIIKDDIKISEDQYSPLIESQQKELEIFESIETAVAGVTSSMDSINNSLKTIQLSGTQNGQKNLAKNKAPVSK